MSNTKENMSLIDVGCNLCGKDNTRYLFTCNSFDVVKCRGCGMIYIKSQPSFDSLCEYYSSFSDHQTGRGYICRVGDIDMFRKTIRKIQKHKPKGRLLDIGCSFGSFLEIASAKGYSVQGVEVNRAACKYVQNELGFEVFLGALEEAHFPSSSFEIATMFNVIEHLSDPLNSLREVNRVLSKNGILVIVTGNTFFALPIYWFFKYGLSRKEIDRRETKLSTLFTAPEHLYHFTPKTIKSMLEMAG